MQENRDPIDIHSERAAQLRSQVEDTYRHIFDDPRMVSIRFEKPAFEVQNELPNLIESFPQIKNLILKRIAVEKKPLCPLQIDLFFSGNQNSIHMHLLETGSDIVASFQQSEGYFIDLKDDADTPIAECLRQQLFQEVLNFAVKCREEVKSRT